ncbi:zinc finger protein 518B isoform X2 [Monodelphis domestica]|uniref:Zinc finger protein 518B n=1 Tax=Monodelphis domestica TaxID=13616 RepID=A0A5F8HKC4_MONDO|nr:zinc finger protein 518B isoform X2 [Monodelphis domestica]
MPGTDYAEDRIPRISLTEGLELNTQLFLEMQIKKMKEIIPQLYTDQVNDKNNSLTTSPKQLANEHVSQPNGHESQSHGYQDSKAEDDKMCMVTCLRCRSLQKVPLQELKKDNQYSQIEDQMFFVCVKCTFGVSPPIPFMNDMPGSIDSGNKDATISRTITNQFKVKNFQPGKYYCDKCRFSTKDPLQYKKHTLQHEEIKFFCSHCSYVSYTKGEFQRHLVKHTGTFPYQCEYCDYGAVRNDYIVKHTRRVHETSGEKRPLRQVMEHQPKRTNFSKQNSEVLVNEVSKSNSFLNEPTDSPLYFPSHGDQDKTGPAISLPETKECSRDEAASAPDKACLPEPSKVNLFENENVEVELLSPAKEPVQPGMPLTVVAPAELRVPENCLAQLIDVKVVNGTQQLVLKLIPMKEKNGFKLGSSDEGKYEPMNKYTVPNEQEKLVPTEPTPPAMEGSPEKPLGINNLHSTDYTHAKDLDCIKSSDSQVLKNMSITNQCESCPNNDRVGNWRQEVLSFPYRTALSPVSSRDGHIEQNNFSSLSVMNNGTLCSPVKRLSVLPTVAALSPCQERSQNHLEKPSSNSKPTEALVALAKRDTLPVNQEASLNKKEVDTFKMVAFSEKLNQAQAKEPSGDPNSMQDSTLCRSEQSHINLIRENDIKTQDPEEVMSEDLVGVALQNSGSNITSSDGPVISSVFSLSSGVENIPEGIKWDNACFRTKSFNSLQKKIAQLIAATESSKTSLSPSSTVEQQSLPLETPLDCIQGHNAPSIDRVPPQALQNNATGIELLINEQMQHHNNVDEQTKAREVTDNHDAVSVFIPKDTGLKAFSSTENEHLVENKLPNGGNKRELSKSVSFNFLEQIGEDLSLTNESQLIDSSRNFGTSLGNKPNQEYTTSTVSKKSDSSCPQTKEDNNQDKQEKLTFSGPSGSKINTKQALISKKKNKIISDSSHMLPDVCIFMTARHLRLIPLKTEQLIKCPRRNQPVVVLNHPDVDSVEVINVMKVVHKYKGNVLKVVLSERTCDQLGIKRHHRRLIYQNLEAVCPVKKTMLKMKLKKIHKNSYQVQSMEAPIWAVSMNDRDVDIQESRPDVAQQQQLEEQASGTAAEWKQQ